MELPEKRKRRRSKRGVIGVMKEDMAEVEVTAENTEDRNNWRWKSAVATPGGKSRKKKKKNATEVPSDVHNGTLSDQHEPSRPMPKCSRILVE